MSRYRITFSEQSGSRDESAHGVAAATGTFYGQAMTAGDIYTVAGSSLGGFGGDGGPATGAQLDYPSAVAVNAAGDILVSDGFNDRIRQVGG